MASSLLHAAKTATLLGAAIASAPATTALTTTADIVNGVVVIPATAPQLQLIGRFAAVGSEQLFDQPGCEIRARIQLEAAAAVTVTLAQRHLPPPPDASGNSKNSGFQENAFVVHVDGHRQGAGGFNATFATAKEQADGVAYDFNITTGGVPLSAGVHDIRIFKATEADWNGGDPVPNYVAFSGFKVTPVVTTPMAAKVSTSSKAALARVLLDPPPLPTRKLEFLGDSITAGYCNECKLGSSVATDHEEAHDASWAPQIGAILNAQVQTTAWSGLGMVRNCCGGNTTMPTVFARTLATVNGEDGPGGANAWDFKSYVPDALVVNLGTNDGSAVEDPKYHYRQTYTDLVMNASAAYGPDLHVFLACGPMSSHYCQAINDVIGNVTAKGVKAHLLDQTPFLNGTFGPACCGHPSIEVDTAMAAHGADAIKHALGW